MALAHRRDYMGICYEMCISITGTYFKYIAFCDWVNVVISVFGYAGSSWIRNFSDIQER
jgi:hypothetical protein